MITEKNESHENEDREITLRSVNTSLIVVKANLYVRLSYLYFFLCLFIDL